MKTATELPTHQVTLQLSEPIPDVEIGADVVLKVRAVCPFGCDLRGSAVHLSAGEDVLATGTLGPPDEEQGFNESDEITVKAPGSPGEHAWTVVLARREGKKVVHEEAVLPISVKTRPHATSLAVWDVPSPVVIGDAFKIKVGARSSGACELKGAAVEVRDQDGNRLAGGTLGDTPWAGTAALYWTEIELTAPATEGIVSWSAAFSPTGVEVPHDPASGAFSFAAVRPPEHTVTVTVVDKENGAPLENAYVRVGPHRAATDQCGVAKVGVPAGTFELIAWKTGYFPPSSTVEVTGDVTVQLEAEVRPEDNPWALPV